MTLPPLTVWSLRRVLLAGSACPMRSAMEAQLRVIGARIQPAHPPLTEEALCRTLHEGRFSCIIAPDLSQLCPGDSRDRLAALNILLGEAREAGVPLVMLLSGSDETAPLFSHALGCAIGAQGDPVSVQCIRHSGGDMQRISRQALALGARFLAGETDCMGMFALGDAMHPLPHTPSGDFAP